MSVPSGPFVPLVAEAPLKPRTEDFRVLVSPHPEKARALAAEPLAVPPENAGPNGKAKCKPRVVLHREGDRVSSIQVHCSCGEIIDLNCDYSQPGSAAV